MRAVLALGVAGAILCACAAETTTRTALGLKIATVPLTVVSEPSGATVAYTFSLPSGADPMSGTCTTPCTLAVPNLRRIGLRVSKPGYRVASGPAIRWAGAIISRLDPDPAVFKLEPVSP